MDIIYADANGIELGYLTGYALDLDIGDTNDFEISVSSKNASLDYGYRVYVNGTEYGGIVKGKKVDTAGDKVTYYGKTWRGILENYVIPPPIGCDYFEIANDFAASDLINVLLSLMQIDDLFSVESSALILSNVKLDRYCTLLSGITKTLKSAGYRLNICCINGKVILQPVEIKDYSDELEYSQDCNINFRIDDNRGGVNHLICLGSGELKNRQVINLYLQENGQIGFKQYYTGINERAAILDYSNAESLEELEKSGREKFEELLSNATLEMSIDDINVELGDIVGGRERITGMYMAQPITQKIVKSTDGKLQISYKVG